LVADVTYLGTAIARDTLFAIGCGHDDDEVVALDAETLAVRSTFHCGLWRRGGANGIAVVGELLFVGDILKRCLHVFSLAGEHVQTLRGEWREPEHLLAHAGRLYVSEQSGADEYAEGEPDEFEEDEGRYTAERKVAGRRILVVSPQAKTLQVWQTPCGELVGGMSAFGSRLIVRLVGERETRLVALEGI
jgi:hypothetical protein